MWHLAVFPNMLHFTINNSNKIFITLELHKDFAQVYSQSWILRKFWKTIILNKYRKPGSGIVPVLNAGCTWRPMWLILLHLKPSFLFVFQSQQQDDHLAGPSPCQEGQAPWEMRRRRWDEFFYLQRHAQAAHTFRLHAAQISMRDAHPCLAGRGLWLTPGGWSAEKARS